MRIGRYGFTHTTDSAAAVHAFDEATTATLGHRPGGAEWLTVALHHDPDLPAAHALTGFAALIRADAASAEEASAAHERASIAIALRGSGTPAERAFVEALAMASAGRFLQAADRLDARLADEPCDALTVKLVHALRFMSGDLPGMLASTTAVLPHWSGAAPGYGYVLGCHAFALEETGAPELAERSAIHALRHEPSDAWGLHALAHVHLHGGRIAEGTAWLERTRPVWRDCRNFAFHLAWHLALLHLELGDHAAVLDLYDREVRPDGSESFRDVANAVSLLWRLREEGVAVGERWDELVDIARRRSRDTTLVFATLHHLLTLVTAGSRAEAEAVAAALARRADAADRDGRGDDQDRVAASVGRDLARAILDLATERRHCGDLARLAERLPAIGGSAAQRDVFLRALTSMAARSGDRAAADRLLVIRRGHGINDRFERLVRCRMREAAGMVQDPADLELAG